MRLMAAGHPWALIRSTSSFIQSFEAALPQFLHTHTDILYMHCIYICIYNELKKILLIVPWHNSWLMNGECAQNTRSQRTTTISLQTSISRKMCISTIFALANGNRAAFWQTICCEGGSAVAVEPVNKRKATKMGRHSSRSRVLIIVIQSRATTTRNLSANL